MPTGADALLICRNRPAVASALQLSNMNERSRERAIDVNINFFFI
jgi:hypothetical protein